MYYLYKEVRGESHRHHLPSREKVLGTNEMIQGPREDLDVSPYSIYKLNSVQSSLNSIHSS